MAKHEVQLTKNDNSIYVGDLPEDTAVYGKSDNSFYFVTKSKLGYTPTYLSGRTRCKTWKTLSELIADERGYDFFKLPDNRRITTTKSLTVEELKNSDHVGFVGDNGWKFAIFICADNSINAITPSHSDLYRSEKQKSVQDLLLPNIIAKIYRFDTRKELYQWLSED